jgi:hypothetical protein
MGPVLPGDLFISQETKVGIMHKGGRLKGLARGQARHPCSGEAPQFLVDQRK